jgi:hypothetical protein
MSQPSAASPVNVRSFGARGDGVSDDTAGIQKALDSLRDGGALFFPKGQYAFSQTIRIPSRVRLHGDGKQSAILLYQGSGQAFVSGERTGGQYGTGTYYLTLENITIRGADRGTGLYLTSRYLTITNAEISHFGVGMDCQACWTNKFTNVSFFYNRIAFRGGAYLNANSFVNCIFSSGQTAVTLIQGANISFVGCQFEAYTGACFAFNEARKSAVWNLNITGCYFENKGRCLEIGPNGSVAQLNLSNNLITTGGPGLAILIDNRDGYGKNGGLVENNTFFRDNQGSTDPFVHLEGPAYLIFRGNKGYATPGYQETQLLDSYTQSTHATSVEEELTGSNRLACSGTGAFERGVVIGGVPPRTAEPGLLVYERGKLKIHHGASSEYLQAAKSGPSAARPAPGECVAGMAFFDTTLGRPIWWNGAGWVDAMGEKR